MTDEAFNLYEAKTHLSELVDRAAAGEQIIIAKRGRPMARLVPLSVSPPTRRFGGWEGRVEVADDFDELPNDLLDAFSGQDS